MSKVKEIKKRHLRRKRVIRKNIYGTSKKPRLSVFRSIRSVVGEPISPVIIKPLSEVGEKDKASACVFGSPMTCVTNFEPSLQ